MSWNQTPPPLSPLKPRIQQQSWDGTPAIDLYDPNTQFFENVSNINSDPSAPKNSTLNANRKINYSKYCLPSTVHQISDPESYNHNIPCSSYKSPKSPSMKNSFEFELSVTPHHSRSPLKSVSNHRYNYEDSSTSDLEAMLTSSIKKNDAPNPNHDNKGICAHF
jgi:hypothetical protein